MNRSLGGVCADPIFRALNPEGKEFMRARILPSPMNPFNSIQMTALLAFGELPHIKAVPVIPMMLDDLKKGRYVNKHTVVVSSSGNTAHVVARLARAFGFEHVKIVLPAGVPFVQKELFSGLSMPEVIIVAEGMSAADRAKEEARKPGHYHLNQYTHKSNAHAHWKYTGPEIMRALGGRPPGLIAIPMGSGGTVCGVGQFLKEKNKETVVLGVCSALGERVPGVRDKKKLEEIITIPWRKIVDEVIAVRKSDAIEHMHQLWNGIEPQPGLTSGLAYAGLVKFVKLKDGIERERIGSVAFICPDSTTLF